MTEWQKSTDWSHETKDGKWYLERQFNNKGPWRLFRKAHRSFILEGYFATVEEAKATVDGKQ